MQEIVIKGRNQKFARKDTQHLYMVIRPKNQRKTQKE